MNLSNIRFQGGHINLPQVVYRTQSILANYWALRTTSKLDKEEVVVVKEKNQHSHQMQCVVFGDQIGVCQYCLYHYFESSIVCVNMYLCLDFNCSLNSLYLVCKHTYSLTQLSTAANFIHLYVLFFLHLD